MKRRVAFGLLIAAIVIGTLVLVLSAQPEEVRLTSADGLAKVSGVAADPGSLHIKRRDDMSGPYSFVVCPVYDITPDDANLTKFLELSITCDLPQNGTVVYSLARFDPSGNGWERVSSKADITGQTLTADIGALGLWTVVRVPDVDYQGADELLLRQLIAEPPSDAVAYGASLAISTVPGDFLLEGVYNVSGCGGRFVNGTRQMTTSLERQAVVTIDGQRQVATVRLQTEWQLNRGCGEGEVLE